MDCSEAVGSPGSISRDLLGQVLEQVSTQGGTAFKRVEDGEMALLTPGSTCWKVVRATRLSLIQDAGPYFAHLADTFSAARRSIFVLGWDVDSRTVLRHHPGDKPSGDEHPGDEDRVLLPFLCRCLERNPELEVFILAWDFSFVYAFEREPAPRRQFGAAHPRLHFAMDSDHGSGGSHHQKIVVVDDQVAFVGGIDLTLHRWDTPAHAVVDPRRKDAEGELYGPFHEIQAAVAGPAAAALGELARQRWTAARRPKAPPLMPSNNVSAWPPDLSVDVQDIDVGFARTLTRARKRLGHAEPPVHEIETLTLRSIAAARHNIYAENQYLTSRTIVRALGDRLVEPDSPEIVLVLPRTESGWKEQSSMGLLRDETLAYLRGKDLHGRLRVLTPMVADGRGTFPVSVHSKVLVVDDRLAKIGSANFSNRSLGLDSECDLVVEAGPQDLAASAFVASVRNRLLGEHLGLDAQVVAARLAQPRSLCRTVDEPRPDSAPRTLVAVPSVCEAPVDLTLFDGAMVDPPEPWNLDMLMRRAVPTGLRRRLARRWKRPIALTVAVLAVWVCLKHFDPGGLHLRSFLKESAAWIAAQPAGAPGAVLAIALAAMVFIPITLLATTVLTVFPPWPGIAIVWTGAVLSALGSHLVGSRLGPRAVAWLPQRWFAGVRRFLGRRAFWSIVLIRLLPVGNFGALNLFAGAMGVPRRAFLLGNMVGLLPGLVGLGLFVNRAIAALRHPNLPNIGIAAAIIGIGIAMGVVLKRWLRRPLAVSETSSR
jgi:phospholipase D1/2